MHKAYLDKFISKYNLGGVADAVLITANGTGINTRFMSDDQQCIGNVQTSKIELEDGEYGIYDTSQLRSLLSVLDENTKMKVVKTKGSPTGFQFSDKTTKVTYVLADKANIPSVPGMKTLPDFEVTIDIDEQFLQTFIRAKGALPDVATFTVLQNQVILGYSEKQNTNRVAINVNMEGDVSNQLSFSAPYLREILSANKEMTSGKLRVSSKGLAHISFEVEDFEVEYYLVRIDRKD